MYEAGTLTGGWMILPALTASRVFSGVLVTELMREAGAGSTWVSCFRLPWSVSSKTTTTMTNTATIPSTAEIIPQGRPDSLRR